MKIHLFPDSTVKPAAQYAVDQIINEPKIPEFYNF